MVTSVFDFKKRIRISEVVITLRIKVNIYPPPAIVVTSICPFVSTRENRDCSLYHLVTSNELSLKLSSSVSILSYATDGLALADGERLGETLLDGDGDHDGLEEGDRLGLTEGLTLGLTEDDGDADRLREEDGDRDGLSLDDGLMEGDTDELGLSEGDTLDDGTTEDTFQ